MSHTRWYANVNCLLLIWSSSLLLLRLYFHCFLLYLYVSCCMNKLLVLLKIHRQLTDSSLKEWCKRLKKCQRKKKWGFFNNLTKKLELIFIHGSKILLLYSKGIYLIINSIQKLKKKKLQEIHPILFSKLSITWMIFGNYLIGNGFIL